MSRYFSHCCNIVCCLFLPHEEHVPTDTYTHMFQFLNRPHKDTAKVLKFKVFLSNYIGPYDWDTNILCFYEVFVENVKVNFHRIASTVMLVAYCVRHGCCYSQPEELYLDAGN
jgi:hypothetical protein